MIDHHIQQSIIQKLNHVDSIRFKDLQPDTVENKLFDYHLKKVIAEGLVQKDTNGEYSLTPEGNRLGSRLFDKTHDRSLQAQPVLFLVIREVSSKKWLIYKRKTQPLLGLSGFMHTTPQPHESIIVTAEKATEAIGVQAAFKHRGSGYFRISSDDELESFTHFDLLVCDDASGSPTSDSTAEYYWVDSPLREAEALPNMEILMKLYGSGENFFYEASIIY